MRSDTNQTRNWNALNFTFVNLAWLQFVHVVVFWSAMPTWKRILLKAAGLGIGIVIGVAVVLGLGYWYSTRPKPPKPWIDNRISATVDYFWTGDDGKNIEVNYILENKSDNDFSIEAADEVRYEALYKRQNAAGDIPNQFIKVDFPIFVAAHSKKELTVELVHELPNLAVPPENGTRQDVAVFSDKVYAAMQKDIPNILGVQLRVPAQRVVVKLPFANGTAQK